MKVMRGVWMCLGVWLGMAVAVAAESRHDDWVIRGQGADSPWLGDPENLIPEKYTDANTSGLRVTASVGMPAIRLDLTR